MLPRLRQCKSNPFSESLHSDVDRLIRLFWVFRNPTVESGPFLSDLHVAGADKAVSRPDRMFHRLWFTIKRQTPLELFAIFPELPLESVPRPRLKVLYWLTFTGIQNSLKLPLRLSHSLTYRQNLRQTRIKAGTDGATLQRAGILENKLKGPLLLHVGSPVQKPLVTGIKSSVWRIRV